MLNFTLTITAAPELLAALSNFTNSITSAKVVTIPETNPEFTALKASQNEGQSLPIYNQTASQPIMQAAQNLRPQQVQALASVIPMNNQPMAAAAGPVQTPLIQGAAVPTSAQAYTMEQLAVAATQLVDAGRRAELVNLLSSFGVQALTALPKEHYGAFATQLRGAGAKI